MTTFRDGPEVQVIQALLADIPDPSALLAGLFAHAPVAFQVYRADGRCLLVNESFRALFGGEPPPEYNVLRDEIAARNGVLERIHRAFAGETVVVPLFWYDPRELQQVRVNEGRRVAIESTFFPLRDALGAVTHVAIAFRDRTDEALSHAQLEAERDRLHLALDAGRLGAWEWEVTTGRVTWSTTHESIHGLAPGTFDGTFEGYQRDIHPDDRDRVLASIQRTLTERIEHHLNFRIVRPDGQIRRLEARGKVVTDARGEVVRLTGVCADVTEQEQNAEALRASRERLEVILHGVTDGITMTAPNGEVLYANDAAARLMGSASAAQVRATAPEAMSHRFELFDAHGGAMPAAQIPFRRALAGETVVDEIVRFRMRGEATDRWSRVSATPVRDASGAVQYVVNFFRDMTAQWRAEEALRFIAQASAVLASSLDYDATVTSVTRIAVPAFSDWCAVYLLDDAGAPRQIAVSHDDPAQLEVARVFRQSHPVSLKNPRGIGKVLRTGESDIIDTTSESGRELLSYDEDHRKILRALGVRSAMSVAIPAQGRTLGAITFVLSTSGRVFDARDLALAEELARRVGTAIDNARLFETTQRERRRAEDANRARDEFLSVASHELRTPLNAILGWSHMLRGGGLDAATQARALEVIERNARAQARLIEDLLDVSNIMSGTLRYDVAPVALGPIAEAAVQAVRHAAEARGVEVQFTSDAGEAAVRGASTRLQQVVWNLCANAVKFTPRGGRVIVRVARLDTHLEVVVSDTGEGIAPSFLPHVFETFRQADSSSTRAHGGLGLGLSIVKHLVEAHGGDITARSEGRGKGATFTVRLPLAVTEAVAPS